MRIHCLLLLVLISCTRSADPDVQQELGRLMALQEDSWNSGDIDGFMKYYHQDVCFLGRDGQTCGRDKVANNYRRSYPDQDAMGNLEFDNWEVFTELNEIAWVTGSWTLHRAQDTLSGRYSLLWQNTADGWRIFRDHSDVSCN